MTTHYYLGRSLLSAAVFRGAGQGIPRQAPHGRTAPNITASDVQQATAGVYILSFLPTRNDAIPSERSSWKAAFVQLLGRKTLFGIAKPQMRD